MPAIPLKDCITSDKTLLTPPYCKSIAYINTKITIDDDIEAVIAFPIFDCFNESNM